MITLRRAQARHHLRRRKQEVWLTFYSENRADPLAEGFGALKSLNENYLPPGTRVPLPRHDDADLFTYVSEGTLARVDSTGRSSVIETGEFHQMTVDSGIRHSETNVSRTGWARVFQIWLRAARAGLPASQEQKRFSAAQRRGVLCAVASPDGRRGSLRTHQDAVLYSAILDPGQHVVHELCSGRSAWLHVVRGEATLGDFVLASGDGAGVTAERAVSFTAWEETEILLVDLAETLPSSLNNGGIP